MAGDAIRRPRDRHSVFGDPQKTSRAAMLCVTRYLGFRSEGSDTPDQSGDLVFETAEDLSHSPTAPSWPAAGLDLAHHGEDMKRRADAAKVLLLRAACG